MNTHTLSGKLSKKSAKNIKVQKKTIRTVLAIPGNDLRSTLESDETEELNNLLERFLPAARIPRVHIPWCELKGVDRAERREFRKKFSAAPADNTVINSLVKGINAVTRGLEKNEIEAVLIATDVEPPIMIKHIKILCKNKQVPLLMNPSLRNVTKSCLGHTAIVLGFKRNPEVNHFQVLTEKINEIFSSKNSLKSDPKIRNNLPRRKSVSVKRDVDKKEENVPKFEYLIRTSATSRVFNPAKRNVDGQNSKRMNLDNSASDAIICSDMSFVKENYIPLKIKRMQNNPNRKRRKTKHPNNV